MKEKKAPGCKPASWVPREPSSWVHEVRTQLVGSRGVNPSSRAGFLHPGAWVPREPSSWVREVRTQAPRFLANPALGFARYEPRLLGSRGANPRTGFAHPGAWVPRKPNSWVREVRTQAPELGSHTQEPRFLANPSPRGLDREGKDFNQDSGELWHFGS
ncbi:hypothetical protein SLEP1_g48867 [Rubroshorea leprosula]|uniref:Uncharacterized protein n=1 Tax=Rubroshorea leprosula TaxID=152421 RepID=A0AAV5LWY6_9ROSI|nr:hypothetical protein SLEP1_g48867 [Rubroshorea leprosula]